MSDEVGDRKELRRQIAAAAIVLSAAVLATIGTLWWSFWALVAIPPLAMLAAVRLAGRGELRVTRESGALTMTVSPTEGITRKIVTASLAFSVAFAIPTLVAGAIEGLIPSSPILVFVAIFIAIGIALAVRALSPTVVTLGADGLELQRGRATRRIPFAEVKGVSRDGSKVTVDAGPEQSATIACAGPTMADAVTTRLRDALEAWQAT